MTEAFKNITEHKENTETQKAASILLNESYPLKQRFRSLFTLRNIKSNDAVEAISKCFSTSSVLLKHELAYVLGQMQNTEALPILRRILEDGEEDEIVRHEAAEAIATYGRKEYESLLRKYADKEVSKSTAVSETCEIGANLIAIGGSKESIFGSLDPALSSSEEDLEVLSRTYLDESLSLYQRYSALFKLRDIGTEAAVHIIAKGFHLQKKSDLFEHEVAFVFGQLSHPASVPYLAEVLADESRHEMIRHEAAEALGSIETDDARIVLEKFKDVSNRIIRESVEVALDIHEYKVSDELEYCN
ncbi:deoxyhypusine monooxygenase [Nematocida sp. LUAm3]|nr:deoxyhypusine monooxygenase [Nematocida sp. LUAm3]KAI5176314.1 deoxyhypusine monooxygenase [Nematocida sp. LUAm2]KAI5178255.1 deoxyhypusine monooxygenase [Nematocida sp. LUAm1]